MVIDLLKEVRDEQREQGKCLSRMEADVSRNTDDMVKHIENNVLLKALHEDNQRRIVKNEEFIQGNQAEGKLGISARVGKLEAPAKAKEYFRSKYMKWAGVISITVGIGAGLGKIFGWY